MVADSRIEADALDDLARVQPLGCGIGIQFVEERHAQGEVGVGEQLDRLCFCRPRHGSGGVRVERTLS